MSAKAGSKRGLFLRAESSSRCFRPLGILDQKEAKKCKAGDQLHTACVATRDKAWPWLSSISR